MGLAADLVVRVAAVIPLPSPALFGDDAAWASFEQLVDEAAALVAHRIGRSGAPALRALFASPVVSDPVCRMLTERALIRLNRAYCR